MSRISTAVVSFFLGMGVIIIGLTLGAVWIANSVSERETFTIDKDWTTAVNEYRTQNNIAPVNQDYYLNTLAAAKCNDMVERKYYAHDDPQGKNITDLSLSKFNVSLKDHWWGENIMQGTIIKSSEAMEYWYNSEGHRKNILNPHFTRVGHSKCYSGGGFTMVEVFTDEY